ncbi:protein ALP1-like [Anneissia japonica]|uniref:protein ALP1-like n=1 Tax=Anneissia japonica TaxID=1529436 RepID=UPI0014256AA4|nr:protein ALP1-like [Anneissia japonica]
MASNLESLNISLAIMQFFTQWQMQQRQIDARLSQLRRRRRSVACQLKALMEKMYPPPSYLEEEETMPPVPVISDEPKPKKKRPKKKKEDASGKKPRVWTLTTDNLWFENTVQQFSDLEFLEQFHVSRKTYHLLCEHLRVDLTKANTNMRKAISVEKRVAVSLYMLSKPKVCTYRHIGTLFSMGKSTIGGALYDFSKAVCKNLLPQYINFPSDEALVETKEGFNALMGFPDCIGVLNFAHIPLFTPLGSNLPTEFLNDKGWYSMILMCVTDHRNQFTYVKSGFPGKLDNLSVFKESSLHQLSTEGKLIPPDHGYHLVAGNDIPLQNWIMTPFVDDGNLNHNQKQFNERINSLQNFSEVTIDKLKGRWGFLLNKCNKKLDRVSNIFLTCCVLHNLCERHGDGFLDSWQNEVRIANQSGPHQPVGMYCEDECSSEGIRKRDEIANNMEAPEVLDQRS